ncbi:unnamed protein product, partial [Thlaspi arvense]
IAEHQYERAKTIVLWDTKECKIPYGLDAGDVSKNIKTALEHTGYTGRVSIMATGDAKDDFCCHEISLNHFPAGERDARLKKVIADLMEDPAPWNLLLIVKDIPVDVGVAVDSENCNLLVATPEYPSGLLLCMASCSRLTLVGVKFSQLCAPFAAAKTDVFWDIDDCPIPDDLDPEMISQNIRSALKDKAYLGEVSISAYGDTNQIQGEFCSAGITPIHVPAGETSARVRIMVKLVGWALDNPGSNLMLIVQDISRNSAYMEALHFVRRRNCKLLIAQPQDASGHLLRMVSTEWRWSSLSYGGKPITQSERKSKVKDSVEY